MTDSRGDFVEAQQRMLERYEVRAEPRFVDVPSIGGRAHVLQCGDGPAVVMMSGIGTPAAMWAPLMAHLPGLRLLAVDPPAYGLTDAPPGFAAGLRQNAVRFLAELLDGLGLDRAAFVSNSLGSLYTCWLALDHPGLVSSVAHVGCPALTLGTFAPLPMRLLSNRLLGRLITRLQPPSARQVEQLSKMVNEHPLVPDLAALLLATERLPGFREMFLSTLNSLGRLRGPRPSMSLTHDQLARIDAPALVVWGRNDPFGSVEVGERMVEAMPAAELRVVEGGHAPWLTSAREIGPMITGFMEAWG